MILTALLIIGYGSPAYLLGKTEAMDGWWVFLIFSVMATGFSAAWRVDR